MFKPQSVSSPKDNNYKVCDIDFVVTELPHLNLLARNVIAQLGISVDYLLYHEKVKNCVATSKLIYKCIENDTSLQSACKQLCKSFPEVFKNDLIV